MKRLHLAIGTLAALTSVWAIAQESPESLLPPGFDDPAPAPRPAPKAAPPKAAPKSAPVPKSAAPAAAPKSAAGAVAPQLPPVSPAAIPATAPALTGAASGGSILGTGAVAGAQEAAPTQQSRAEALSKLSLDQLAKMSPEELGDALGLEPSYDIPAFARRSTEQVGVLDADEGGLPHWALVGQDARLVRAAIAGNNGRIVSRWGHIMLRRALASRLSAPAGMNPADFAALRVALLARMGEGDAARAVAQDVDANNYTDLLADAALDAYVQTADFTGICPIAFSQASSRKEPRWEVAQDICRAFRGESTFALRQLDRATGRALMPRIDMLLAQRYAGAAGKARRAVTIEWDGVKDMTPWRYGLTLAVGLEPPAALTRSSSGMFDYMAATAPMLGSARRAEAADRAGAAGILSSAAMVDLYGQVYADGGTNGEWPKRAERLRDAYVGANPAARLAAMQDLWNGASDPVARYSRQVLTAFAAARLPVSTEMADNAGTLIASMLAAGLDRNAMRWASVADTGTEAWGQLVVAAPSGDGMVSAGDINSFVSNDESENSRKSGFLVAGLAGLGRIDADTRTELSDDLKLDLGRSSRWSQLIDQAANVRNPVLVAILAGVGMQGSGWDKMTARHLYHIVSALNRVGLDAEARMIAAEAVARG